MEVFWLSILFQLSITSHHVLDALGLTYCCSAREQKRKIFRCAIDPQLGAIEDKPSPETRVPCFWKGKAGGSNWEERIQIEHLTLGQELAGHVVEDLLDGKTGPKVFFECGVGSIYKGKWRIVHGMLRLPRSKRSVAVKRAARLRKKKSVQLFVSRIQEGCGRFEVCSTIEEAEKLFDAEKKRPVASLRVGEEVIGVVVKLLPYGAMVDVGANRLGLLHIRTVAELHGRYIDKEKGLMAAGLERGAKVRLSVASIDKRRLSLEFMTDVRMDSENVSENVVVESNTTTILYSNSSDSMSNVELAEWAEYATGSHTKASVTNNDNYEHKDEYYDEEDEYDEDKDIEDSLGLGFY